jgi:hypothetical protein
MIPLHSLHPTSRYPKMIRCIIKMNLESQNHRGKGNRAARRMGKHVIDPFRARPFGLIGMDRAQIAKMMGGKVIYP